MRKAINQIKHLFAASHACNAWAAKEQTIDLNVEEKAFVNLQTHRMLLRKQARQFKRNPQLDWTASLPMMPRRGSAYALYNAK